MQKAVWGAVAVDVGEGEAPGKPKRLRWEDFLLSSTSASDSAGLSAPANAGLRRSCEHMPPFQ
jgi:hypothetical protein